MSNYLKQHDKKTLSANCFIEVRGYSLFTEEVISKDSNHTFRLSITKEVESLCETKKQ